MSAAYKIRTLERADVWVARERAARHKIGFTCGAFDVMHAGHADYLAKARDRCDRLLVAVNSDESIQRYKSPLRPVNPWKERAFVVASLASTDCVVPLEDDRPLALLERWKPDVYIKGGDYQASTLRSGAVVQAYGGESVVIASDFSSVSTTAMFDRVAALALHETPSTMPAQEAAGLVLLDRDGTLIRDAAFDPTQVELLPGVADALKELQAAGLLLCLMSNQQGIGLGYFGYREFVDGNRKLLRLLGKEGIAIRKIYFCPHSVGEPCECRKPAPGLILQAQRDLNIPAERTFVIGDAAADIQAAGAADCAAFYVGASSPAYGAVTFSEASRWILELIKGR